MKKFSRGGAEAQRKIENGIRNDAWMAFTIIQ